MPLSTGKAFEAATPPFEHFFHTFLATSVLFCINSVMITPDMSMFRPRHPPLRSATFRSFQSILSSRRARFLISFYSSAIGLVTRDRIYERSVPTISSALNQSTTGLRNPKPTTN